MRGGTGVYQRRFFRKQRKKISWWAFAPHRLPTKKRKRDKVWGIEWGIKKRELTAKPLTP
ncbi:MAG: hypothetical protein D3922_14990 [Candidatus Electrothrix sp. AR1]|nr:hypothetical protein [Candidatus Electrothrix sp. AR1]